MDIGSLLNEMRGGLLYQLAVDPRVQFGTPTRRYLGAELLPERLVSENQYTETQVKYRAIVANSGSRFSPPQKKGGVITGSFDVKTWNMDKASDLTARDYDALLRFLRGAPGYQGTLDGAPFPVMQAVAEVTNFLDTTIRIPLVEILEVYRWQAIVDGVIKARGDNGWAEDITVPTYAGLRGNAAGNWSDNTYDPFTDIFNRAATMATLGEQVGRIIMSTPAFNILANNTLVRARVGRVTVSTTGQIRGTAGRASLEEVNAALSQDGLPPIERYDLQYATELGFKPFLRKNVMVLISTTGRDERVDLGGTAFESEVVPNTLGYTALGRAAGQAVPGRRMYMQAFEDKPPRIECQGWQEGAVVITEPQAVAVIDGIQ